MFGTCTQIPVDKEHVKTTLEREVKNIVLDEMRKKTKNTTRRTKSNQKESKLVDQSSTSIVFVDENSSEIHVQDQEESNVRMGKKNKNAKRTDKSSQGEGKLVDENSQSIVFVDENAGEIHVQDQTDITNVEENIKDDSDRVIAVIDKNPEENKDVEEDEDDDVPEDVSWKASKESVIRERIREKEVRLDIKRKEKQMRIERNERLQEQKERKRAREYSRLPVEVLQQIAKQQESQADEMVVTPTVTGDHLTFDSSSEDEQEDETEDIEETPPIKVLVLPRETKKPKKIQESASLFLQQHLFGDRIQRISATNDSDWKQKQKSKFRPATKFSKKYL